MNTGITTNEQRQATCECGATFTQWRMSDRFLNACATIAHHEGKSMPSVMRELGQGFVPLRCPPCEHKALDLEFHARHPYLAEKIRRSTSPREPEQPPEAASWKDRQFAAD